MPPDSEFISTIICPRCHAELPPGEMTCSRCGASTISPPSDQRVSPLAAQAATETSIQKSVIDKPWFVLVIIFGAAMFLGLPLLWKSRGFSLRGKIIVSILTIIYSVLIFWGFFLIMASCYETIRRSM